MACSAGCDLCNSSSCLVCSIASIASTSISVHMQLPAPPALPTAISVVLLPPAPYVSTDMAWTQPVVNVCLTLGCTQCGTGCLQCQANAAICTMCDSSYALQGSGTELTIQAVAPPVAMPSAAARSASRLAMLSHASDAIQHILKIIPVLSRQPNALTPLAQTHAGLARAVITLANSTQAIASSVPITVPSALPTPSALNASRAITWTPPSSNACQGPHARA